MKAIAKIFTFIAFSILTFSSFKDCQAQGAFESVKIGRQEWMVDNLNVNRFRNGDAIPEAKTNEEWRKAGEEGRPAWCYYGNDPTNGKKIGKLYNWYAVVDKRGLAPKGWHIPSEEEFNRLMNSVRFRSRALKAVGQGSGDESGTNSSGFSAILGGMRDESGNFSYINHFTAFWSLISNNNVDIIRLNIYDSAREIDLANTPAAWGLSVRCVRH